MNRFPAWWAGMTTHLSYRPARLHRLAESITWNRFLSSINVYNYGLCSCIDYPPPVSGPGSRHMGSGTLRHRDTLSKGRIVQGKKLSGTPRSGTHLHGIPYNLVVLEYLYQPAHWYMYSTSNPHCKQTESQYLFFSILETVCCNTQRGTSPLFYCVILKKINKEIRETYSHVNWEIKWTFPWFLRKQKCPLSTRPGKFKRMVSRKNRIGYTTLLSGEQKTNFNFWLSY